MKKRALFLLCMLLGVTLFAVCASARTLPGGESFICVQHKWGMVNAKKATCTEAGYTNYQCTNSNCNETKQEPIAALGHDWSQNGYQPATCTKQGANLYECTRCSADKSEPIAKLEHDYQQVGVLTPTCGKEGAYYMKCANCGDEKTIERPATGNHNWEHTHTNRDDVECVADGTAYYICTVCGDQKNEGVPALGHDWKKHATEAQTCTADGKQWYKCSRCGDTKFDVLPASGHNWKVESALGATCGSNGSQNLFCGNCGATKTETIPATGNHSWQDDQIIKAPTCTEEGKASSKCAMCGKTEGARVLPALGHTYGKEVVVKAATCTATGESTATCSVCNHVRKSTIKATGHSWGEWKVTKEATTSATGSKERICKTCGVKETETIPKKVTQTTTKPSSSSSASSRNSSTSFEAGYGTVEVFTTSGKVNMRNGPSKDKSRVIQVDKKNTCLGELLDAQADNKGIVWFKVKYKGKSGWITSDYAKAVVGALDGRTRRIEGKATELASFYLRSMDEAMDKLQLEEDFRLEIFEVEAANEAVFVCGNDYAEVIELTGEGYTLYGVKIGDKIKDAQKKLKKADLVLKDSGSGEYVYNVICSKYSLAIDAYGFDGKLTIVVDDNNKVESMLLEANAPVEE